MLILTASVEKREKELDKMHQQVVKDKKKIEDTIATLDQHKISALQTTWEKVSGSVFSQSYPSCLTVTDPGSEQ